MPDPFQVILNRSFVPLAVRPFVVPSNRDEPCALENLKMPACGGLRNRKGLRDQRHANPNFDGIGRPLMAEVPPRPGQEPQYQHPGFAGQRSDLCGSFHAPIILSFSQMTLCSRAAMQEVVGHVDD